MAGNASGGRESRAGGEFTETVVKVRRCATVVKGGRRFSFAGLVVVGNGKEKLAAGTERQTKCLLQSRRALKMA